MKAYCSERAIISITSWKARIHTVGLTLFSLIKQCPGFHIVLVLSEEEFPKKEEELPYTVMAFVNQDLIELLWTPRNYKAFKKVIFTIEKYKGIPVISADDDCLYICNYAEQLYQQWVQTGANIVRYTPRAKQITQGPCTLYSLPHTLVRKFIDSLTDEQISESQDDPVFSSFLVKNGIQIKTSTGNKTFPFIFHNDNNPLTKGQRNKTCYAQCFWY